MRRRLIAFALALFTAPSLARAQSFEAGLHFASSQWSEFDGADSGFGGRFTWKPSTVLGVEADLTWYPSDFPGERIAFSGSRVEGLFGVTAGPRLDRVRPFGKAAFGFLRSSEAPEPFACIAIFPPPLSCLMAAGHTMPAIDLGGGVEISATDRTFVRADVSARMLRYPGPTFSTPADTRRDSFWGTAARVTVGAGMRF